MKKDTVPLVSVIVPVYNVSPWLRDCMDSLVKQSLEEIEIICVNDGSTDCSPAILAEYEKKDTRVHVIHQENGGLSAARNTGVRAAKGKYISFVDSDDLLGKTALASCTEKMERHGLEFLTFNAVAFGEDTESAKEAGDKNKGYFKRYLDDDMVCSGSQMFQKLKREASYITTAWSCMLLRSVFLDKNLWFHPGILHEDEPWTFQVYMNVSRCGCLSENLYYYRLRKNSISFAKPGFKHAYGIFAGYLDARDYVIHHQDQFQEPDFADMVIDHVAMMQKNAIRAYRVCEESEKQLKEQMTLGERVQYRQNVELPAAQMDELADRDRINRELHAWNDSLQSGVDLVQTENDNLARMLQKANQECQLLGASIEAVKGSASYRLGNKLLSVPRKIRQAIVGNRNGATELHTNEQSGKAIKESSPMPVQYISAKEKNDEEAEVIIQGEEKWPRKVWLFGTPEHNNMGDQCIAMESVRYLQTIFPQVEVAEASEEQLLGKDYGQIDEIPSGQPVFLIGGGNFGTIWPGPEAIREEAIRRLKSHPVIILPQSIFFSDDAEGQKALAQAKEIYQGVNVLLCCRDKVSWEFAKKHFHCKTLLVPDIAMWERQKPRLPLKRFGGMTLLRGDKERKLTDADIIQIEALLAKKFQSVEIGDTMFAGGKVTKENRNAEIERLLRQIASAECVVTDRLHGMILCAITETPCVVLPNGYHKVAACYEWLKEINYISMIQDVDHLEEAICRVCGCREKVYPEEKIQEKFKDLSDYLAKYCAFFEPERINI